MRDSGMGPETEWTTLPEGLIKRVVGRTVTVPRASWRAGEVRIVR